MITQQELKSHLDYDPQTGVFYWRPREGVRREWNTRYAGTVAGYRAGSSYRQISLKGKSYYAHRLAWMYVYGCFPKEAIDHVNCDKDDNRIENLREATPRQNNGNMPLRKDNTSGYKGVYWNKQRRAWQVTIHYKGKSKYLGLFADIDAARGAYLEAARDRFGSFARAA